MIRRYAPMKKSAGTQWPREESEAINARDGFCVGPRAGFTGECYGQPERDHVRASHGIGMKSESTRANGVLLCSVHHKAKTENGRELRPLLLAYLGRFGYAKAGRDAG